MLDLSNFFVKRLKSKNDNLLVMKDLSKLLCPGSVAIVGASGEPRKVGAIVLKNIILSGFKGTIYPVNPNINNIGLMKFYPKISSLPEIPDLIAIAIPAPMVNEIIKEAGEFGVKNAVIFSAGYKEAGEEGALREKELKEIALKYSMNIIGPNCLGVINNSCPINVTFGEAIQNPGEMKIISQSGALATAMFDWCEDNGLGFEQLISIGNKTVTSENEILEYWKDDGKQSPIGLYLESITDGIKLKELLSEISKVRPVFVLKPGKSAAAAKAMQSHTGSIAGADYVLEEALKEAGVIRCHELGDFFDIAKTLSWIKEPQNQKVAVITNAGGPGVLSSDTISDSGLEMAVLEQKTEEELKQILPTAAGIHNPIDVLGDALADRFKKALEIVLKDNNTGSVIIILTPQLMTQIKETAEVIIEMREKYQKPILCSFIGGTTTKEGNKILENNKIPTFEFPERAIKTLAAIWNWKKRKLEKTEEKKEEVENINIEKEEVEKILIEAKKKGQTTLDNVQAEQIMTAMGIKTVPSQHANNFQEAEEFAVKFGWPVVLKLSAPGLLHKTEVGGVITQIKNKGDLETAYKKLEDKKMGKIQIQKEIEGGVELIAGIKRDSVFGTVVLFGAGGKMAELIEDRNLHLLPISETEIEKMILKSKVAKLLTGFRGEKAYELKPLIETIKRLSEIANRFEEIEETEINPIKINRDGVWALDAKVVLKTEKEKAKPITFKKATCEKNTVLSGKFREIEIKTENDISYKPGQYITILVGENKMRAYSVAYQSGKNSIHLLIDISPGGAGSKYFENIKEGQEISYLGPFGIFTYKGADEKTELVFLGTGSGCSPLRSMIETILEKDKFKGKVYFYAGFRSEEDIVWKDYFDNLTKKYPNFTYKIYLSQPTESWNGEKGHLTQSLKKDFAESKKLQVYLCGNRPMMEESRKILTEMGCPNEDIYEEKY